MSPVEGLGFPNVMFRLSMHLVRAADRRFSLFFFSFTNPEDRRGGASLYMYGMQQRHRLLLLFILSNCCLGSQCCHMLREVLNVKGVCFFRSFLTLFLHGDRQKLLMSSFQDVVCAVCVFFYFILFCRFNSFFFPLLFSCYIEDMLVLSAENNDYTEQLSSPSTTTRN